MVDMTIVRYDKSYKDPWNEFIESSRNGTFILDRNYMDYHADRFPDVSWLFFKKNKIIAVMPGTISGNAFSCHSGLTYGGLILSRDIGMFDVFTCFELLNDALKRMGVTRCVYKSIPYIYHKYPSQEDLYALFRLDAVLVSRSIASAIDMSNRLSFTESRKSGLRKSVKHGIQVRESNDFEAFWHILDDNLTINYGVSPVHNVSEIGLLKSRFNNNIKLFGAFLDAEMVGGTVVFEMQNVIHVQYISANKEGKAAGALDAIFAELIGTRYENVIHFDFGTSTEQMGTILNESLLFQKEGFGGRGVVYDVYEYNL